MASKNRRRRYFINKEIQIRFAALLVFIAMLTAIQLLAYMLLVDNNVVDEAAKYGLDKNPIALSFIIVQQKALLLKLFAYLILNMFLVGIFGLFFSHRLVGPVYAMEKFLRRAANGDLSGQLKLRRSDHFQGVAKGINEVLHTIRQRHRDEITALKTIRDSIDNQTAIQKINHLCHEIESSIDDEATAPDRPQPASI